MSDRVVKSPAMTVFVVEPESGVRDEVSRLIRDLGVRVETFASAEEFLAGDGGRVGCVVAAAELPGISGWDLQERVQSQGWALPTIVLTSRPDTRRTVHAMRRGAVAVVDTRAVSEELTEALRLAVRQQSEESPRAARVAEFRRQVAALTRIERQILQLIIQGVANKVIAAELGVSLRTIELRRRGVFQKTAAASVADLVRRAVEAQAVENPG